jgi:hypothetical protein
MKRALLTISICGSLAAARPSFAYNMSCQDFVNFVLSNNQQLQGAAVGETTGTLDFLAGLLCFVGNAQCGCVQSLFPNQPMALANAVTSRVQQCISVDGSQAVFGSISRAAKDLCPY